MSFFSLAKDIIEDGDYVIIYIVINPIFSPSAFPTKHYLSLVARGLGPPQGTGWWDLAKPSGTFQA